MPDLSICRVCKDTVVDVTVAANFSGIINCKKLNLYDASTVVAPAVINSYSWSVGTNPGNIPVPPLIASFNNASIPNPVLTFTQSGSYIVSLAVKSGSCTVIHMDTFNISVPNADFTVTNSCVGTQVNLNNLFPEPTNFWDFGDAATAYTSPTFHAYASSGTFNITHIVTDVNGCKDTIVKPIIIVAAPVCTVTHATPLTFCYKDSVILGSSCLGLINFQWYNNGVAISGANTSTDTIKQTGNYSFIAYDVNGCKIVSDTVSVTVNQAPNVSIISTGSHCAGSNYTVQVPSCVGCIYQWVVDGNPVGNSYQFSAISGTAPFTLGTHNIFVQVVNSLGCSDTSSINVTFYALPTVSISVVGPSPFCSNNIYILNATSNAASPSWVWNYNNTGVILSTINSLTASAAGNYKVKVTDGITGCSNIAVQTILPSPELNLFPIGCDTLCDSTKIFLPLQSLNGNLTGYNIDWYDNAPPFLLPVGNGVSFPLSSLPIGSHNLSVIVTSPNGCVDTSNVYSVVTKNCNFALPIKGIKVSAKQVGDFAIVMWSIEQEINNDYFVVERSLNGLDFSYSGKVWSKGNTINKEYYSFTEPISNFNQTIYYRIKIVDKNGNIEYSTIVKLNPIKQGVETIVVLPNITTQDVTIVLQSNSSLRTNVVIYTADGKQINQQSIIITKGLNTIPVSFSNLSSGLYRVAITTNEKLLTTTVLKK
jgi:hypothetical protein